MVDTGFQLQVVLVYNYRYELLRTQVLLRKQQSNTKEAALLEM